MTAVIASISVSLDGYYVGPDPGPDVPLGVGGAPLHAWFRHDVADREQLTADDVLREQFQRIGALVMGRDSYEVAERAWGSAPPFQVPVFVLTHHERDDDVRDGTTFSFVTAGFAQALGRARDVAGDHDVGLHGGSAIRQAVAAGVLDELQLHVVPHLLGAGRRLFDDVVERPTELVADRTVAGPGVTHLRYRLPKVASGPAVEEKRAPAGGGVIVAGHLSIADGQRDAYLASCHEVVTSARAAPGCLDFALSADLIDPDRINVHERWTSDEDLERFRGSGPSTAQVGTIRDADMARYEIASVGPP